MKPHPKQPQAKAKAKPQHQPKRRMQARAATAADYVDAGWDGVFGGTSGWGGSAKLAVPVRPRCQHNPAHMLDLDGVAILVADLYGASRAADGSVVLNCTGDARRTFIELPPSMRTLAAHLPQPRVTEITLPWPDGGIPPVLASFWRALIEQCAATGAPLVIHCIGGHGRTGTALAAILIAYSIPAGDAIEWVRKNHCDRAIETKAQEYYLADLDRELNGAEVTP